MDLVKIDDALIEKVFQRVSDFFFWRFGITNFKIADKLFKFYIFAFSISFLISPEDFWEKSPIFILFFTAAIGNHRLMGKCKRLDDEYWEKLSSNEFVNNERLGAMHLRLQIILCIAILMPVYAMMIYYKMNINRIFPIFANVYFWCFFLSIYFMACRPRPRQKVKALEPVEVQN